MGVARVRVEIGDDRAEGELMEGWWVCWGGWEGGSRARGGVREGGVLARAVENTTPETTKPPQVRGDLALASLRWVRRVQDAILFRVCSAADLNY